ncbi:serine/threonine protein kinase [Accumulibacter sp.]|uniref:serine/threonine protein kinase n=1 Tax=Accumulibacter sp. TaxID=2053492 RepID=UPI0025F39266|nr:serine/threonine protein kinase [Accumulibacter sp.]MCM8596837.1 HDOD domain-containing protein [Accumulibacter sp.]MCM8624629.1 HDOD domain-containing protein [Accumulibacter sp.]MDS4050985.1 HDOD domain-containing protein [Accumulibacter sp.]
MIRRIGRFEVLRELGRGARTVVHLARDPQLQRQVVVKTFTLALPEVPQRRQWLDDGQSVSRLRHPHIIPLLEAAEDDGAPYLVFQYVVGENLGEYLGRSGGLPPQRALEIVRPVLDALAHAHAAGIVHGALKPSNILIDRQGVARVMDFVLAARQLVRGAGLGVHFRTPSYLAPETIAGRVSSERSDIFSVGLILRDLLAGSGVLSGPGTGQVLPRTAVEDWRLPQEVRSVLDDRLAQVVERALALDPADRFESAAQMREALVEHRDEGFGSGPEAPLPTAVDLLLRRMRHESDFPALSESVVAINRIAASENQSTAEVSNTILKDFSLTHKVLRMVNSVCYRQVVGGSISTVSRAVVVLGLDAVRSMATTILLLDHLQNRSTASELRDEFLRANLAGVLARELGGRGASRPEAEQLFVCSMFHNLGRLLSLYYFPDQSVEIRRVAMRRNCSQDSAAVQVLGVSFEDLGIAIARTWAFPRLILDSMRRLPAGSVRRPLSADDRFRLLCALANELCMVVIDTAAEDQTRELRRTTARFAEILSLGEQEVRAALDRALDEVTRFAASVRLDLRQTRFGRQLDVWRGTLLAAPPAAGRRTADPTLVAARVSGSSPEEVQRGAPAESTASGSGHASGNETILFAGIEEVSSALVNDFRLNDVLRIALEAIYRGMAFRRVILCVRDARSNSMVGRFGFGGDALEVARRFRFSLASSPDIFLTALSSGQDVLISDSSDDRIAARIPEWFARAVAAETFLVLPLCVKGTPLAMIYADRERAGEIAISSAQFSLIRSLRNQALLAIRQSRHRSGEKPP